MRRTKILPCLVSRKYKLTLFFSNLSDGVTESSFIISKVINHNQEKWLFNYSILALHILLNLYVFPKPPLTLIKLKLMCFNNYPLNEEKNLLISVFL